MISRLQYISQGKSPEEHLENIRKVCVFGVDWVQLRLKNVEKGTLMETAFLAKEICDKHQAKLIINDNVEVAKTVDAHGAHLGKEDGCPEAARTTLGTSKIIGGTANTYQDCEELVLKGVDYIGLGPFRFTPTKEKLSPVLGLQGYKTIVQMFSKATIATPVIAIGGIVEEDVKALTEIGIHGIAVSGVLTHQQNLQEKIKNIYAQFLIK